MMPKGYKNKKQTSQFMMRQEKRESILGIIIASLLADCGKLERTNPTPPDMKRKDMSYHEAMSTTFSYTGEFKNLYQQVFERTGWFRNATFLCEPFSFTDTNKLKIYYNWLHKGRAFTLERVLKYLYSPAFLLPLFLEGLLSKTEEAYYVLLDQKGLLSLSDLEGLQYYATELLGIESYIENDTFYIHESFIDLIQPTISQEEGAIKLWQT